MKNNKSAQSKKNNKVVLLSLSDKEVEAIDLFQDMLDQEILDIKQDGNYSDMDMYDMLRPFLSAPNIMSKIRHNGDKDAKDKRHVNLEMMVAMRRAFGTSIDDIIDRTFQFKKLPPRKPQK